MDRELAKRWVGLEYKHGPRAEQWAHEAMLYLMAGVFSVEQLKQRIAEEERNAPVFR